MMKNNVKILLLTLILLLACLATVSAENTTQSHDSDSILTQQNNAPDSIDNDIEKSIEKTENRATKTARVHNINSTNYDQYFTKTSTYGNVSTTSLIQAGDTINLEGTFRNVNFTLDKQLTLTSLKKNSNLINCTVHVLGKQSSGSTVCNLKILNNGTLLKGIQVKNSSKLYIHDNHVQTYGLRSYGFVADNMNSSIIDSNTFLREGDDWRYLTFVIGKSYYNNITNNNIECGGANGIYLSIYSSYDAGFEGGASDYNNIIGNNVTAKGYITSWCYTIQAMGKANNISYNTVRGGFRGISTQDYTGNIITHNDVHAINEGIYACEQATVSDNNIHVTQDSYGITIGGDGVKVINNTISSIDGRAISLNANNVRITNNKITASNTYGIFSKGQYSNIIIENNDINSKLEGILFKQYTRTKRLNDILVNRNTIVSQADYAIDFEETGAFDTSLTNVTVTDSNVLTSKRGKGLSLAYRGPGKEQSTQQADTDQKITINASNYDEYFDEGTANIKIKQNATITLSGTFNNKNFIFNKKVHITGKNCVLNQATITLTAEAHSSTIKGITINNRKNESTVHAIEVLEVNNCLIRNVKINNYGSSESLGIFLYGANGNTIRNTTITTSGDYINNGILLYSSDSNTIEINNIKLNQSAVQVEYAQNLMFNEKIGTIQEVLHNHGIILLYSSHNTISKNTVKTTSMFKSYTAPTNKCKNSVVGIDIYFDSHENTVTANRITVTGYGPYSYGMGVLGGYWGSSITSLNATSNRFQKNTVKVTGGYFATGFIAGRNSINTLIESNTFTVQANKNVANHGDYAHGITLENSTKSTVSKNTIKSSGSSLYNIELFDSSNNKIQNNTINGNGTQPYGIAAYRSSNNNITANRITLRKLNYGQSSTVGHSDVIQSGSEAVVFTASNKNIIKNNIINTNATVTVKLAEDTRSNTVTDNSLKARKYCADKSVSDTGTKNTVKNNYLYPLSISLKPVQAKIGQKITITATVKSTTTNLKNLRATFKLGTQKIGTVKITDNKAKINYTVSKLLKPTTYTLTVSINGTNFQNATAKTQATFNKTPVKTVVKVAKVLKTVGSKALLTANITTENGGKIGSGKAIFYLDNKMLATRNVKLGKASYTYSISSKAANKLHTIKVVYNGTKDYAKSSGTNRLGIQSKTSISMNDITGRLGSTITISATVKSGGKAVKTGKAVVIINGKKVATAKISKGKIVHKYTIPSSMNKGTYSIKIEYAGNSTVAKAAKTSKIKISPYKTVFHYTTTKARIGKNATIVLRIDNGQKGKKKYNANGGNVTIKLNNKVMKDSKGKTITGTVKNGKITFKFLVPSQLKGYQNLTFAYKGNSKFSPLTKTYRKALQIS